MKYVIKIARCGYFNGKYCGLLGKQYALWTTKKDAERYNTKLKAKLKLNRLKRTCVNATNADVEEIEE